MKNIFVIFISATIGILFFLLRDAYLSTDKKFKINKEFKSIEYEPIINYSYSQPSGETVNLEYTPRENLDDVLKFYGNKLPNDIVVMSQFDKKIVYIDKYLNIKWTYPSGGRFVRVIDDKIYCSNEFDVKIVDIVSLDGKLLQQLKFDYEINNIRAINNTLLIIPNMPNSSIYLYEYDKNKLEIGRNIYKSNSITKYPRDAIIKDKNLYITDTFGHKIIVEDISKEIIKVTYDVYFPNEIQEKDNFLYVLEEHNDRLLSINLANGEKHVSFSPNMDVFKKVDSLVVPKENMICKEGNYEKSIVSDTCLGLYTLYSPNGFIILERGIIFADTDNHRILYINGNDYTVITGFNNPVKFDIVR